GFNAIFSTLNGSALYGCSLYVTLFPCNECAKAIIQTGIKEVVYSENKYSDSTMTKASIHLLHLAGVKIRRYQGRLPQIEMV
ncbi:MAG: cytidine deaminase, partial [Methanomicrobia archaeon]|nr:cytidine deaminase [Methanomicrobia archaeon]